ncbi:MAG: peptidylprolyl isomerase [Cyanobacteria bacterium P01_A01_bin.135]
MTQSSYSVLFQRLLRQTLAIVVVAAIALSGCSPASEGETVGEGAGNPDLPRLDGSAVVELAIKGETVTVNVTGEYAPITAGNFVDLVDKGVYDGVAFHRVVKQPEPFVVQAGDPQSKDPNFPQERLGTGSYIDPATGAPRYIPLEITPEGADEPVYSQPFSAAGITESPRLPHSRGAVAMARSTFPDSASAQFYITLSELRFLNGEYAVFGSVEADDMAIVDQIEQGDRIESARVLSGLDNLQRGDAS